MNCKVADYPCKVLHIVDSFSLIKGRLLLKVLRQKLIEAVHIPFCNRIVITGIPYHRSSPCLTAPFDFFRHRLKIFHISILISHFYPPDSYILYSLNNNSTSSPYTSDFFSLSALLTKESKWRTIYNIASLTAISRR